MSFSTQHHCRGCGNLLPAGARNQFHQLRLRADKRSRVTERRRMEQERFQRWMGKQVCPNCGTRYGKQAPAPTLEGVCEASRPAQGRRSGGK